MKKYGSLSLKWNCKILHFYTYDKLDYKNSPYQPLVAPARSETRANEGNTRVENLTRVRASQFISEKQRQAQLQSCECFVDYVTDVKYYKCLLPRIILKFFFGLFQRDRRLFL